MSSPDFCQRCRTDANDTFFVIGLPIENSQSSCSHKHQRLTLIEHLRLLDDTTATLFQVYRGYSDSFLRIVINIVVLSDYWQKYIWEVRTKKINNSYTLTIFTRFRCLLPFEHKAWLWGVSTSSRSTSSLTVSILIFQIINSEK